MSILDVKRSKQDFLKHKSKSSQNTFVNYTFIFKNGIMKTLAMKNMS